MKAILLSLALITAATPAWARPFKVVIDPGHGGGDHGATVKVGAGEVTEKDLTLLLALEAEKTLKKRGFTVFLTRSKDQDVPLSLRTALANRLKADLFLSIHLNSHASGHSGEARGVETYILNTTSNEMSRRLAYLENSPNRPNLPEVGSGATLSDGQDDVALILKDLTLGANLNESKRLACLLQRSLAPDARQNRGVKQALFHVLLGADMPSALVEAGFINHPGDRASILQNRERARMAEGIASAIEQFRSQKNSRLAAVSLHNCPVR